MWPIYGLYSLYKAIIQPLYNHYTAFMRPIHGHYTAHIRHIYYIIYMAYIRLLYGHYTALIRHGCKFLEKYFSHKDVNPSRNFVNPTSGSHTSTIKGCWFHVKRHLQREVYWLRTDSDVLALNLAEFMWKSAMGLPVMLRTANGNTARRSHDWWREFSPNLFVSTLKLLCNIRFTRSLYDSIVNN